MKSYSTYYVRNPNIELVRSLFSKVEQLPNSDWLMCAFKKDASPPDDEILFGNQNQTLSKSEKLGEVIFLYGDTSVDGFAYEHALNGKMLRKLVWFPMLDDEWTAGWLCVEGKHEAWESKLFNERELTQYLEEEQENLEELGKSEHFASVAEDIKHAWKHKHIIEGKTYPRCDGTATLLVEQHFNIHRQ